jgi:hypothetical protein
MTIADNVCVSRFRASSARIVTTQLLDNASVEPSASSGEVAGLTAALRELPETQRQALLRRELQGLSYDEIGAELGVSRASVAALIHRARRAVAESLRGAYRGLRAFTPLPLVLRATHAGNAAGGAAAGAAAAVAVIQLAGPPPTAVPDTPASPAPRIEVANTDRLTWHATRRVASIGAHHVGRRIVSTTIQPRALHDPPRALPKAEPEPLISVYPIERTDRPVLPPARPPEEEPPPAQSPEEEPPSAQPTPMAPAGEAPPTEPSPPSPPKVAPPTEPSPPSPPKVAPPTEPLPPSPPKVAPPTEPLPPSPPKVALPTKPTPASPPETPPEADQPDDAEDEGPEAETSEANQPVSGSTATAPEDMGSHAHSKAARRHGGQPPPGHARSGPPGGAPAGPGKTQRSGRPAGPPPPSHAEGGGNGQPSQPGAGTHGGGSPTHSVDSEPGGQPGNSDGPRQPSGRSRGGGPPHGSKR